MTKILTASELMIALSQSQAEVERLKHDIEKIWEIIGPTQRGGHIVDFVASLRSQLSALKAENERLHTLANRQGKETGHYIGECHRLKADNELTLATSELARRAEIEHRQKLEEEVKELRKRLEEYEIP